ncbi:hypothetical protein Ahy_A10g051116 isoform D [Arachis hypogaea]|nr:hypothetical protein Ahy_A10g051116 isoform D [Arachis hypogaea]
MGKVRC